MIITLENLPKVSFNLFYTGVHWAKRKKTKDTYKTLIKSQFKQVLSKDKEYDVEYIFTFKSRPLDASNCAAMIKLIEDIIFEDDNYKIVKSIKTRSLKGLYDKVEIKINE